VRLTALLLVASALVLSGCSDSSTDPSEPRTYPDIDGLVVFYPFDGNLENAVADEHHGTASRAVTFVDPRPGKSGQALHVESVDFVWVADHPDLDIMGELSIGAWISPEASDQAWATLVGKGVDSYMFGMWGGIADPETTDIRLYVHDSGTWAPDLVPMGMDVWSHVAVTFDPDTDRVRFYLNGAKVDSGSISEEAEDTDDDLMIGSSAYGRYKGRIDNLAIFDRVLTGAEVLQLKNF
jgi:hypothetical protein